MKQSKFILLLLLLLIGCDQSALNFPEEFVPGEVAVKFIESVKKSEAKAFIEDLDLDPVDLSKLDNEKHPNWTLIGVPEGKEKFWVKRFNNYSIVEVAELNGIDHTH
ncbi:MAG: hypothetical protein WEA56_15360 [Balneolaceae bacterium]